SPTSTATATLRPSATSTSTTAPPTATPTLRPTARATATLGAVPPVVPGFPYQRACTPGQLLYRQVGLWRITNIIYHNGRIYSNNVGAGERREWAFTTPSD